MTGRPGSQERPAIVGHRGAAGLAPENTLPSFQRAIEIGVASVELDVRLTADGVPVLLHDETLDRTTNGTGPVAGVTSEQLRALEVRTTDAEAGDAAATVSYPGLTVPTLSEALAVIPPPVGCLIELKRDDAREPALVRAVVSAVAAAGIGDRVRLISFQESLIAEARRQAPELPRGFISGRELEPMFAVATRQECIAIHPQLKLIEDGLAGRSARAGLILNTWTLNEAEAIRRAAELGVDEITTDFPNLAHQALSG